MHYKRSPTLTSIPEKCESTEEVRKWVPKNKHEVLKAKYKCLKKLFQIYDASVIGILPKPCSNEDGDSVGETEVKKESKRKQRSTRTKTDASAGTSTTPSSVNVTDKSDVERDSIATTVIRDLKTAPCSCSVTQFDATTTYKYASTQGDDIESRRECECTQTSQTQQILPNRYMLPYERRKLTRFQCFIQRLFGIRREHNFDPNGRIYPASDNNIIYTYKEKRRRRGLRFRRLRRPKKTQSEGALRNIKNPTILSYVQSVQRNCLMDTTPRQCPITGCMMISYGIINYNDHLNLCHFTDRKYICHYCHEGFEKEYDKYTHENEHLGITKLNLSSNLLSASSTARQSIKKASNTQTETNEVHEEKLKKIVSFFDKITSADQVLSNIKKDRYSECNLQTRRCKLEDVDTTLDSSDGDKRTVSCMNLSRKNERVFTSSGDSDVTSRCHCLPVVCHCCEEKFDSRRQLSLHMDLEHRTHHKYSKFHSCAGITNPHAKRCDMHSEDGQINIQSDGRRSISRIDTSTTLTQDSVVSRIKSQETLSCDPSTNIVYYASMEALQPSVGSFVKKGGYKWEPGTKIIRV